MSAWRREFDLADGASRIRVREWGDPRGPVVISHHGTPSSSAAVPGGWGGAAAAGVRLFSFDRPGYGGSPRQPGRRVADAARWSALIADAVGADRFSVVGTSGGGPHAAAAAALLPYRVTRLVIDVGLGPVGSGGFDGREGMVPETAAEIDATRLGEAELRAYIDRLGAASDAIGAWWDRLPPSDREVLSRAEVRAEEDFEAGEWQAQGVDGWVDDDLALFGHPWGFDPAAIEAPTLLAYGEADALVPLSHGQAWARVVAGVELLVVPEAGHWLRDSEVRILGWLAGRLVEAVDEPA